MTTQTPADNRRTPEWKAIRLDLAPLTSLHWDARPLDGTPAFRAVLNLLRDQTLGRVHNPDSALA